MSEPRNILPAGRLVSAEFQRQCLFIKAPVGTKLDDVKDPGWLSHHTRELKPDALLEIVAEDGSFDVTARVFVVAPGYVGLRLLSVWQSEAVDEPEAVDGDWSYSFAGPQRFRVVAPNGEVFAKDIPTKAEAIAVMERAKADAAKAKAA